MHYVVERFHLATTKKNEKKVLQRERTSLHSFIKLSNYVKG